MDTLLKINQIIIDDERRLSEAFVKEAIIKWDLGGVGSFRLFVGSYIEKKWAELVRLN